jgi:hypothetical protein
VRRKQNKKVCTPKKNLWLCFSSAFPYLYF